MILNKLKYTISALLLITVGMVFTVGPMWAQQPNQLAKGEIGISLNGIVIDASTGMGLENVVVKISELGVQTKTNEEGVFSFQNLIPVDNTNEVTIKAVQQGFEDRNRKINFPQDEKVVVQMNLKYPIE